jgi:hypothetical protein
LANFANAFLKIRAIRLFEVFAFRFLSWAQFQLPLAARIFAVVDVWDAPSHLSGLCVQIIRPQNKKGQTPSIHRTGISPAPVGF